MSEEYLRNLPVPFFSQRQNDYQWIERFQNEEDAKDVFGAVCTYKGEDSTSFTLK